MLRKTRSLVKQDCGTIDGIEMTPLVEGGEIIEGLGERVLGRVALEDIHDPFSNTVIVPANEEINEERVKLIEDAGLERVRIRSALTVPSASRHVHPLLWTRSCPRAGREHG